MSEAVFFDNGGRTLDQFAAVYPVNEKQCWVRTMSYYCSRPNEVSTMELLPGKPEDFSHLGNPIAFDDLPGEPQERVKLDLQVIY